MSESSFLGLCPREAATSRGRHSRLRAITGKGAVT